MKGFGRRAILIALSFPALAACGSGNPDALTNPNLEQNSPDEDVVADLNAADSAAAQPTTNTPPPVVGNDTRVDETVNSDVDVQEPSDEAATTANDTDEDNQTTEPPER